MCGIIGIVSNAAVSERILNGLQRLEYRGYDSAGIATLVSGEIGRRRAEGKLSALATRIANEPLAGSIGIGHTRWATHGLPNETNAHPHATTEVAVVHNGIIENYAELKEELTKAGANFETETDTEVVVHLVTKYLREGKAPEDAAFTAFGRLTGAYAIVLIFRGHDNLLVGVRQGTPLAVGYGEGENFLASDSYALVPFTRKITFLEDGDRVVLTTDKVRILNAANQPVERAIRTTAQSAAITGKGAYDHYMQKEMHEQPEVIGDTLNSFINPATGEIKIDEAITSKLAAANRLIFSACGTAFYACMVAKYWFEQLARVPCEVDIASEFRYRDVPFQPKDAALFVSQSGETLDTLEALRTCRKAGLPIFSIVNTIESTIERESDAVLRTLAGPEIGVASSKAFTTQLTTLLCLAIATAEARGAISKAEAKEYAQKLRSLPSLVAETLKTEAQIKEFARDVAKARDVLYLGRGLVYPLALEGALKLKEISYIHAEGYAAGEMKHGPIALIDNDVPIIALAPASDPLFEKTASNLQEAAARGGQIFALGDAKAVEQLKDISKWAVEVPDCDRVFTPIIYAVPVQLLAYYVAIAKGTNVDQPRNLAKSVTVE